MKICEKNECTGCFACYNICPRDAIEFSQDEFGCIYPAVNEEKCIKCLKCKNVCFNNKKIKYNGEPLKVYAVWSKDENIHKSSSSGGLAYAIARNIIERDGYVCSVVQKGKNVIYRMIHETSCLHKIQGSKYVHAYVENAYRQCLDVLKSGSLLLFIGTPCQVQGLKNFLGKEYDNLTTIDLICHGVPPQKYLWDHLEYKHVDIYSNSKIFFRNNLNYGLTVSEDSDVTYSDKYDLYIRSFLDGVTYRENCYNCKFALTRRVGDLTIGDFWGLSMHVDKTKKQLGVSCLLINNSKGEEVFKQISSKVEAYERTLEEASRENLQLKHPTIKPDKRFYFEKNVRLGRGFDEVLRELYRKKIIIWNIKNIVNHIEDKTGIPLLKMYRIIKYRGKYE